MACLDLPKEELTGISYCFEIKKAVLGPHKGRLLLTIFLLCMMITTSIFSVCVSNGSDQNSNSALRICCNCMIILSGLVMFYFLLKTTITDPGIIPRNKCNDPKESIKVKDYAAIQIDDKMKLDLTLCKTCYLVTPPLSHHCYHCDACIERHDHHCIWLGTCIGRRNFRSFMIFIISLNICYFSMILSCILLIIDTISTHQSTYKDVLLWFTCIVISILWIINSLYLTFLLVLIGKGLTSNQYLTKSYKQFDSNPFSQGCRKNFKRVFNCKYRNCSRILKKYSNMNILQEYGQVIKEISVHSEEQGECYKGDISEMVNLQDINETIIDGIKDPLKRSRQFLDIRDKKKKFNDTNFETFGASRDNMLNLDGHQKLPQNLHTSKNELLYSKVSRASSKLIL